MRVFPESPFVWLMQGDKTLPSLFYFNLKVGSFLIFQVDRLVIVVAFGIEDADLHMDMHFEEFLQSYHEFIRIDVDYLCKKHITGVLIFPIAVL